MAKDVKLSLTDVEVFHLSKLAANPAEAVRVLIQQDMLMNMARMSMGFSSPMAAAAPAAVSVAVAPSPAPIPDPQPAPVPAAASRQHHAAASNTAKGEGKDGK